MIDRMPEPDGAVDDPSVEDIPPEGLDEEAGQESEYAGNVVDDHPTDHPDSHEPREAPRRGGR